MIAEIIKVVKISQSKIYIPEDIKKRFGFEDGDKIVWGINKDGEIILSKPDTSLYNYL